VGKPNFKPRNTGRAKDLRNTASPWERMLWRRLSGRRLVGGKFSRQMPIGPYFADFLCREARLVIELDGDSHDFRIAEDARRNAFMARAGYRVLRFTNADVRERLEGVLLTIAEALAAASLAHPRPLPHAGGEK